MKDLYDIMNDDNYINSIINDDTVDIGINMGQTLGFSDYLSSANTIYDMMDDEELMDQLDDDPYEELSSLRSRNNKRGIPVPEFEQYVQKVCGLR